MRQYHLWTSLALIGLALAGCRDDGPTGVEAPRSPMASVSTGPAFATMGTTPAITRSVVNDGPGDQTDPHVSGSIVAYTSEFHSEFHALSSEIRYHDLATGLDALVPKTSDQFDFLPDVSGSRIVFTRVTEDESAIYLYDLASAGTPPVEIGPLPAANRRRAHIGGTTVAFQDFGFNASVLEPEMVVHDLASGSTARLTTDAQLDKEPAVGPNGDLLVWTKCHTHGSSCDIWQAVRSSGAWTSVVITGSEGEEDSPDTDGEIVTYQSTRLGDTDIYWRRLPGGAEQRLALGGEQVNPNVSGGLITFESLNSGAADANYDLWAYDTESGRTFPLTSSLLDETLNDVSVSPTGLVRVVHTVLENGSYNVYALSFQRRGAFTPVEINVNPGSPPFPIRLGGPLPVISVIVRTTSSFDAALVKPATATLGDGVGTDASVAKHNGAPIATLMDVDKDGDKDLVLAFRKADLVAAGDLTTSTTKLVLRAELTDGSAQGEDVVKVIP